MSNNSNFNGDARNLNNHNAFLGIARQLLRPFIPMLFLTHLLLGLISFLLVKEELVGNQLIILLLILLGSILPDIDEENSRINKWGRILGKVIAFFSKHRGMFHSLLFAVLLSAILGYVWSWYYGIALFIGYLSHLIGDALTPMGIQVFYPFLKFRIKGPIKTGGWMEWVVRIILVVLIVKEIL
ncbi:metal-dependent hydrolase [Candidatus Woesearchaeota archaeon]|nr:metal-dependent hydrolase [Candidatus Woesearchaeota archaeon]